ncbi:MAG: macro domain-containing protein [Paludibacteraceae bacterium]|nr:macro domain-containing protein [Paludibacteraceae bacterium]
MPLLISRNDITLVEADAIVNAANARLQMGGGVCGAIFRAAGPAKLQAACDKLAPIETGQAVITDGFDSKAKYIIHAVGPIYQPGNPNQEKQLYDCYFNSLRLAADKHLESIAFPLISSGIYGYPPDEALSTAQRAIHDFLGEYEENMIVYLIVYNNNAFSAALSMCEEVESYINEKEIKEDTRARKSLRDFFQRRSSKESCSKEVQLDYEQQCEVSNANTLGASAQEDDIFDRLEDSFSTLLFKLIRRKQMTNAEVYKNANLDRRLFSKIISNEEYTPRKNTVLALAISLKLNLEETQKLLRSAGYAISHSSKADLIIEYYILHQENKYYNIDDLNFLLFQHKQVQLGQVD